MSTIQWVDFKPKKAPQSKQGEDHYLPTHLANMLKRQQYAIFGHSGVKTCHYTKKDLTKGDGCYKKKFYGISSHECMQMTPSISYCEQKCTYCWRPLTEFNHFESEKVDEPEYIVEKSIEMQRKLLSGFGSQEETIGKDKLEAARNPKHVAI